MKEIIHTTEAPEPIGPYSQAVKIGTMLYCSGQIPINPVTGDMPEGIEAQTRQVMDNLSNVLKAADTGFDEVIKTSIFLTDLGNFSTVNRIYGEYFNEATAPARATVQVAALPKGAQVEIDAIAAI